MYIYLIEHIFRILKTEVILLNFRLFFSIIPCIFICIFKWQCFFKTNINIMDRGFIFNLVTFLLLLGGILMVYYEDNMQ